MNRILQIVLAGVIGVYFLQFLVMTISLPLMFRKSASIRENPGGISGKGLKIYAFAAGPARLSVETQIPSNELTHYFGFRGLAPDMKMNDDYYMTDAGNQLVKVKYEPEGQELLVPVSEKTFYTILVICVVMLVIYVAIMIYVFVQLFQFAREAGKENFFTGRNKHRLRLIGWFILGIGIINFLFPLSAPAMLEMISGCKGLLQKSVDAFPGFPGWIIAGLLLLIIAEAFGKGLQLQQEQDYTV